MGLFKSAVQIVLLTGFGYEFERHNNYWVVCFGIDYEFEINHNWQL
jgi:hypothetical protein